MSDTDSVDAAPMDADLIDTEAETNLARRGNRLLIPTEQPLFPARCVMTNRTDDLIGITGDLEKLANPRMVKAFGTVVSIGLVGGSIGAAVLAAPAAGARLAASVAGAAGRGNAGTATGDAAVVRFAVNRESYRDWEDEHKQRKFWIRVFVTAGVLCLFGSIASMIAFPTVAKNDPVGFLGVGLMFLGALCAAAAGAVAVIKGQPLLHGVKPDGRYISVKGAGESFLESLPSA